MGWLGAIKKKKSAQPAEVSQLKEELRRVSEQLESRERELAAATEQQTATNGVLRVISGSPTNLQPVFERILANTTRLCVLLNFLSVLIPARTFCLPYLREHRPQPDSDREG